ncbi:MAG: AAA family ATPase [Paracoccaceae bacterium]
MEHHEITIGAADNQAAFSASATDLSDLLRCTETHGDLWAGDINRAMADNSGCDLPLAVSMFADVKAQRIEPNHLTLRQLQDRLTRTAARDKAALPLVKLATFGNVRTIHNSLRHDANLLRVSGVEGDYDAGAVSPQEAAERLHQAGIAALIYTTPSHTAEAPRWRVLAPLVQPVAPAEREALCARLNGALGGILATESFTPSQSYYFGAVKGRPVESVLVEGQPLDRLSGVASIGPQPKPVKSTTDLSDLFREPADRAEVRRALDCIIDADDRALWLKIGMALNAEFTGSDEGFDLWSHWSRQSLKFDERDQRQKWKSFRRSGVGIGTLFEIAKGYGYERPSYFSESDFDDLPALSEPEKPKPSTLTFLTPDDCESAPSRGYLIKGLFAPGDVACIFGAPGAGKSLIAPFLGYMVAQGQEAFQMRTKAGGVFYVAAEDSHGMRGRVKALKQAHGSAQAFRLVEGVSQLLTANPKDRAPDLLALVEVVKAERPALIFIDTLAMAFPGLEENSAEAMGRVVAVSRLLTRWGAAVVLIHHDTKSEGGTPRGHSLLNGALDVALHVKRDDEAGIIRGRLTKNRNGTCDRDIAFTIATENGGTDEDGEPITLPRCNPLRGAPAKVKRLAPQPAAALKVLEGMAQPVSRDDWKRACMASDTVCANDKSDTRRKAFDRALQDLSRDGWVTSHDGFYSIRDGFDVSDGHGQSPDMSGMSDTAKRHPARTDTDISL